MIFLLTMKLISGLGISRVHILDVRAMGSDTVTLDRMVIAKKALETINTDDFFLVKASA